MNKSEIIEPERDVNDNSYVVNFMCRRKFHQKASEFYAVEQL